MELPAVELALHLLVGLTYLDQAEREPAGSPPELFDVGVSSALLLPALVGVADVAG